MNAVISKIKRKLEAYRAMIVKVKLLVKAEKNATIVLKDNVILEKVSQLTTINNYYIGLGCDFLSV